MYRFALRPPAVRLALVVAAGCFLSGCASLGNEPAVFGGVPVTKSIKDDAADASPPPQPKAQPKAPPKRARIAFRPATGPSTPACEGGGDCASLLKSLIESPGRSWIGQPESAADHATGTRLFAYRALRDRLSCLELSKARAEIEGAAAAFKTPVPGVTSAQAKGVLALNAAVNAELRAEQGRRCRG